MLGGWAGLGSLSPQNCSTAGLQCHSKTSSISAAPLSLECLFVGEAQSSWDCSSTMTWELGVEVPRLLLVEGIGLHRARGLAQPEAVCLSSPALCVRGVLHSG